MLEWQLCRHLIVEVGLRLSDRIGTGPTRLVNGICIALHRGLRQPLVGMRIGEEEQSMCARAVRRLHT